MATMMIETSIKDIKNIKIHGRTTSNREPLILFWTASGFECNVSGSELWVEVEVGFDVCEPWFSYTVNGDWVGRQMLQKGRYWICLFRGMTAENVKNVRFYKDLQAMSNDADNLIKIHALRHDGEFYPVEDKKLKIEFIGDSITSGEGLFGAKTDWDWIPMCFSSLKNYAYFTSTKLGAEYRVFSQSGWGVHCGWDNNLNSALPKYYREICSLALGDEIKRLGAHEPKDFEAWQPDFIIVNLGTNDAGAFDSPEWTDEATKITYKQRKNLDGTYNRDDVRAFQKDLKGFLYTLRECNKNANIIWCYGMIGTNLQLPICEAISEYISETDDNKVSYLQLPATDDTNVGAREHPGELCHRQAADVIAKYITKITEG
jgi:lysophospholipase L1-like esterase